MTERERNKQFRRARTGATRERARIQRETRAAIVKLLKEGLDRIRVTLASQPSDYQLWSLPQLRQAIEQSLSEVERGASAAVSDGARRAWDSGRDLVDKPIEAGGVRIAAVLPELDTRQLNAMRTFTTGRIKDITQTAANRINNELGLVIIGAQSPGEAIGKVSGILDAGRERGTTIVRTEVGRAFSTAANERLKQASETLPKLKKQWRRSGKIHSRLHHDSIDGQVREVDEPFTLGNGVRIMFPRDPAAPAAETINCGCESLPFMEEWDVKNPGRVPFTDEELRLSQVKRDLAAA